MAKRRWHVPMECRDIGARAHGTSEFRIAEASLGLQSNGNGIAEARTGRWTTIGFSDMVV